MRPYLLVVLLTLAGCPAEPCKDSVTVIQSSWTGQQGYVCPHPNHTMITEQVGLTKGSVKVTCSCKAP